MLPPTVRTEVSPDEEDALRRLLRRIEQADPDRSPSPDVLEPLQRRTQPGHLGVAIIRRPTDLSEVATWAQAWRTDRGWQLAVLLDPDEEGDVVQLGAAALHPVLALVGEAGGGRVQWWVRRSSDEDALLAERLGFDLAREVVQLRRSLPLEVEDELVTTDLETRPFRPGEDDEAWLAVNAAAFADHPDQGAMGKEDLRSRRRERWFDADGFLVHETDGSMDGFCWTKVHRDHEPPLGEIYVIGVAPEAAGKGLGRALVVAGLTHLAELGLGTAMLWTEHDNEPARHLYEERLGFELHHVDRLHTAEIATPD